MATFYIIFNFNDVTLETFQLKGYKKRKIELTSSVIYIMASPPFNAVLNTHFSNGFNRVKHFIIIKAIMN